VLRGWDPARWRSPAEGKWLIVENADDQLVTAGSSIVVTEGPRIVAVFRVTAIDADPD
jgi:hypothetical protein